MTVSGSDNNASDIIVTDQGASQSMEKPGDDVIKNLELVQRFVSAIFADPSLLDQFSGEVNVVLIPDDDPELAAINLRGGCAMRDAGKPVRFVHV